MAIRTGVDFVRLGDLARVSGAIVLVALVVDGILRLAFGPALPLLRSREHLSTTEFERIGGRLASAERDIVDERRAGVERPLVLVVGLSTARVDIDPPLLSRHLCAQPHVLNLGSSGGSFRELRFYLEALRWSTLHPSFVILGVHPAWLAGYTSPDPAPVSASELSRSASGGITAIMPIAARALWSASNRVRMHSALTNPLLRIRAALSDASDLSTTQVFAATDADPWTVPVDYPFPRAGDEFLAAQLDDWEKSGWFNADRVTRTSPETEAWAEIVRQTRGLAPTVVVLMPEASQFRSRTPLVAESTLRAVVTQDSVASPLLDLRATLPDGAFYDNAHLNPSGRALFTGRLADRVRPFLRCGRS